jgi:hypothetical protein
MDALRFVQTYPLPYLFFFLPPNGCLARMRRGAADGAASHDGGGGESNGS